MGTKYTLSIKMRGEYDFERPESIEDLRARLQSKHEGEELFVEIIDETLKGTALPFGWDMEEVEIYKADDFTFVAERDYR